MSTELAFAHHTLTQTQTTTGRISFAARIGCIRAMRLLNATGRKSDPVWAELETAACLPPLEQVSTTDLREESTRNADALLGCGSPTVLKTFSGLLPRGAQKAILADTSYQSVAVLVTPEMVQAADIFETTDLLPKAFLHSIGHKDWAGFWHTFMPALGRQWLTTDFWGHQALLTCSEDRDPALHVAQLRALIGHAKAQNTSDYGRSAMPRMPKPDTLGPLVWLEHAAFAHLLDAEGKQAYPVMDRKKALDVNASVKDINTWMLSRALWRQSDGEAAWGTDPVAYLQTPRHKRQEHLLSLCAPTFETPKTAKPAVNTKIPGRHKDLKAFMDDAQALLTIPMLTLIAKRYTTMIDKALSSTDAPVRDTFLEEAKQMRTLLTRKVGQTKQGPYDTIYLPEGFYDAVFHTGSLEFIQAGRACTKASYDTNGWAHKEMGVGKTKGYNLEALVNRAEIAFLTGIVPMLDRVETWKLLVLAQHKTKAVGPILDALDKPEGHSVCGTPSYDPSTTHLGMALDYGIGRGHMKIGQGRALWDITSPDLRVAVFQRLEKGKGFSGIPGKNVDDFETAGAGPDAFLLDVVRHAKRNAQGFAQSGKYVTHPCLVRDLITQGKGEAFLSFFPTVEDFVRTNWDDLERKAKDLLQQNRLG